MQNVRICSKCLKDKNLKKFVCIKGSVQRCTICNKNEKTVDILASDFKKIFKAVIRYHYSEREYNSHWGGHLNWIDLFYEDNEIFVFHRKNDYQHACFFENLELIEGHIKDEGNDVSLYHGGKRLDAHFSSIKDDYSYEIRYIKQNLDYINYYILLNKMAIILERVKEDIKSNLKQSVFYRARVGFDKMLVDSDSINFDHCDEVFVPFKGQEISAPPIKVASEGRLNRKNCSFLYLASNEETAISEVRPSVGHYISTGQFDINNGNTSLSIADFNNIDFYNFSYSDSKIYDYILLNSLKQELSIPNPDKDYRFTQIIAEALIKLQFDGVIFDSSVSEGYNLVLFDTTAAQPMSDFSKVVRIEKVSISSSEVNSVVREDANYYEID